MNTADLIWMNGEFVAWEDAKVHVLTHALHYGTGVFEGIRAYETERGTAIFRHRDHLERLERSAELYYMDLPVLEGAAARGHARADRPQRAAQLLHPPARLPRLRADGARPARRTRSRRSIAVWEWGAYLGEEGKRNGVRAKVSSWRRISPRVADPARQGLRPVPQLACWRRSRRRKAGYEEAILLDDKGHVCEGTGENMFVVQRRRDRHARRLRRASSTASTASR